MDLLLRLAQRARFAGDALRTNPSRIAVSAILIPDYSQPFQRRGPLQRRAQSGNFSNAMHSLTEGEARVLKMYYGLDGHEPMTLEKIGAYVGRTRERVRQIKEKALQKLRPSCSLRLSQGILHRTNYPLLRGAKNGCARPLAS